jgi:flagellar motor component MotA
MVSLESQYRRRGRSFAKGQSGNPAGRQKGSRNKATLAAELYLDGEAEGLLRKAVELAHAGSALHMKLVLDRTIAPRRERPTPIALPTIASVADIAPAMGAVAAAVAGGVITTGQAAELAMMFATLLRAVEAGEFDRRLREVENGRSPE